MPILSLLILPCPLFSPSFPASSKAIRQKLVGLAGAALDFLASLVLLAGGGAEAGGFGFGENRSWLPALGVSYHVGVDGPAMLAYRNDHVFDPVRHAVFAKQGMDAPRSKEYYAFLLGAGSLRDWGVFLP